MAHETPEMSNTPSTMQREHGEGHGRGSMVGGSRAVEQEGPNAEGITDLGLDGRIQSDCGTDLSA